MGEFVAGTNQSQGSSRSKYCTYAFNANTSYKLQTDSGEMALTDDRVNVTFKEGQHDIYLRC